jgi:hypothetical protein
LVARVNVSDINLLPCPPAVALGRDGHGNADAVDSTNTCAIDEAGNNVWNLRASPCSVGVGLDNNLPLRGGKDCMLPILLGLAEA